MPDAAATADDLTAEENGRRIKASGVTREATSRSRRRTDPGATYD